MDCKLHDAERASSPVHALVGRAAAAAVIVSGSLSMMPAQAQIMVGDSGSASASVAIKVPPGVAGLQPSLSLGYSGSEMGDAGKGWSLRGISAITRCPSTRALDGQPGRVNFNDSDKLCLDGIRLVQTDASGNAASFPQSDDAKGLADGQTREFRTESDLFVRVRAYGTYSAVVYGGNSSQTFYYGPKYFKAWTKDGKVYEFGLSPGNETSVVQQIQSSRPAQAWVLTRVTDLAGNQVKFTYQIHSAGSGCSAIYGAAAMAFNMDWGVQRIDYASDQATQTLRNSVVFSYDALGCNGDRAEAWYVGAARVKLARLSGIATFVNGNTPSRRYELRYATAAQTGRSLLQAVAECSGSSTACQPATSFAYTPGSMSLRAETAFALTAAGQPNGLDTQVFKQDALPYNPYSPDAVGVIEADFNGDGRPDFLIWSDNPANNVLYLSEGTGNYRKVTNGAGAGQFNITSDYLFQSTAGIVKKGWGTGSYPTSYAANDYCFETIVADFNGDGLPDILRTRGRGQCAYSAPNGEYHLLFLSNGDGSFTRTPVKNASDLSPLPTLYRSNGSTWTSAGLSLINNYSRYFIADVDRDGKADIVQFTGNGALNEGPDANFVICAQWFVNGCGATLWKSNGNGTFTPSPLSFSVPEGISVPWSSSPSGMPGGPVQRWTSNGYQTFTHYVPLDQSGGASVASMFDVNGDGAVDLTVNLSGTIKAFLGNGNGSFTYAGYETGGLTPSLQYVPLMGDYNGDGRLDAIWFVNTSSSGVNLMPMYLGWGGSGPYGGMRLVGNAPSTGQGLFGSGGFDMAATWALDVDGDGRTDIAVLTQSAGGMLSYFRSLGDGRFAAAQTLSGGPPYSTYQQSAYVNVGNYAGTGGLELLLASNNPSAQWPNQLYVKTDATPPDLLLSVTLPSGQRSRVDYESLTRSARYASDRVSAFAAVWPQVEITPQMFIVKTLSSSSGVGTAEVVTEFGYRGYKEDQSRLDEGRARPWQIEPRGAIGDDAGRRSLGFREVRRQSLSPDGSSNLTQVRKALQVFPYIGSPAMDELYLGGLSSMQSSQSGALLSRSEMVYCDSTSATGAAAAATSSTPCASSSVLRRPYVRKTTQSGSDLLGNALPTTTVTTTFTGAYPTQIDKQTSGTGPAGSQTFSEGSTTEYFADNVGGDNWLLGLIKKKTSSRTVPNALGSISTSAGSAPNATATSGP